MFQSSATDDCQQFRASIPFQFDDKDIHSLEKNHTHLLLLDDGKYTSDYIGQDEIMKEINYPKEIQRSDFVTYACDKQECNKAIERFR